MAMIQWLSGLPDLPILLLTAVVGGVMMLDTIPLVGILVPADVAILVATAGRSPAAGFALAAGVVLGCLAGWSASFFLGRHFGTSLRASRIGVRIGSERWTAAERLLTSGGIRVLMAAPFLPVVNTLVPLAAGCLQISYRRFLPAVAVGSVLWTGLYIALGLLGNALRGIIPNETAVTLTTTGIGLALAWLAVRRARTQLPFKVSVEQ
jgi:membrane protein DedA with SNARE-associated domain